MSDSPPSQMSSVAVGGVVGNAGDNIFSMFGGQQRPKGGGFEESDNVV